MESSSRNEIPLSTWMNETASTSKKVFVSFSFLYKNWIKLIFILTMTFDFLSKSLRYFVKIDSETPLED
jgi:hypothetical protein